MKVETHRIETAHRVGVCTVTEHEKRVVFQLRFSEYDCDGDCLGDERDLFEWLLSIVERYRDDKRRMVSDDPVCECCGGPIFVFGMLMTRFYLIANSYAKDDVPRSWSVLYQIFVRPIVTKEYLG